MSIFKYTKIKNLASNISFFYFCLGICPSLPVAYKYLGFVGLICYSTLTYYILLIFQRNYRFLFRNLRVIFSAFFLLSISLFLIVYPWANARSSIGKGSDRDEALHIGVGRILRGLYPYSHQENTYFDKTTQTVFKGGGTSPISIFWGTDDADNLSYYNSKWYQKQFESKVKSGLK